MKDKANYYKHYEKLMKMNLEQSIVKTFEYRSFSQIYPNITESIILKREIKRLTNKLKSEKKRSVKIKIKREINIAKTKLRKNNLLKRLHGESKQEAVFQRTLKVHALAKRFEQAIRARALRRRLRMSMHKHLPPSILSLRELDVSEKGLALREWIQESRKKNR